MQILLGSFTSLQLTHAVLGKRMVNSTVSLTVKYAVLQTSNEGESICAAFTHSYLFA